MADTPVTQAPPNPLQLFRQQYPGYKDTPDSSVYKWLSQPQNFRRAFPGYAQTPDASIQKFMGQYAPKAPQPTAPTPTAQPSLVQEAKQKVGEAWDKVTSLGAQPFKSAPYISSALLGPVFGLGAEELYKHTGPEASTVQQVAAGALHAPQTTLAGMMSPQNLALIGGMAALPEKGLLRMVVDAGFTAQMAHGVVQQLKEGYAAAQAGDTKRATELLTGAGIQGVLTALAGTDLAKKAGEKFGPQAPKVEEPKPVNTEEMRDQYLLKSKEAQAQTAKNQAKYAQRAAPKSAVSDALPRDLAGSKPRYGYRNQNFEVNFASPLDKALYTVAQETKNPAHDRFMSWLRTQFPGESDTQIITRGRDIRSRLKEQARTAATDATSITLPKVFESVKSPKTGEMSVESIKQQVQKQSTENLETPEAYQAKLQALRARQAQVYAGAIPTAAEAHEPKPMMYPDEKTQAALEDLERKQAYQTTSNKVNASLTKIQEINHTLDRTGKGRVAQITDLQEDFLKRERAKLKRQLKIDLTDQFSQMEAGQRTQEFLKYGNEAAAKRAQGNALIALSKQRELAPEWLVAYADGLRAKNPQVARGILATTLKDLKAGVHTPEDLAAFNQVHNYLATLYEAEQRLGERIPSSMVQAHLRKLGNRFLDEGKFADSVANVLKGRLGVQAAKPEAAPMLKIEKKEQTAPKAAEPTAKEVAPATEEPKAALPAPEPEAKKTRATKAKHTLKMVRPKPVQVAPEELGPAVPEHLAAVETPEELAAKEAEPSARETAGGAPSRAQRLTGVEATPEPRYEHLISNLANPEIRERFDKEMTRTLANVRMGPERAAVSLEKAQETAQTTKPEQWLDIADRENTHPAVKRVIAKYNQAVVPQSRVHVPIRETLPEPSNLSPRAQELTQMAEVYEGELWNKDITQKLRDSIPDHFKQEQALEQYVKALSKYVELNEAHDPDALIKAINVASKDPERGAVSLKGVEKLAPDRVLERVRQLGYKAWFTSNAKPGVAGWLSPDGEVWVEGGENFSHMHLAQVMVEGKRPMLAANADRVGRAKLQERYQANYDTVFKEGWIRKSSQHSYEVWKYDENSLKHILDSFQKDLYEMRQVQEDPALFLASHTDLKGKVVKGLEAKFNMEVPTTWSEIRDKNNMDLRSVVSKYLGRYTKDSDPSLYSGIDVGRAWKTAADKINGMKTWVKSWAINELNGGRVPSGFLRRGYIGEIAHGVMRQMKGEESRASAILKNDLDAYREDWKHRTPEDFRNFIKAHEQPGTAQFASPKDEELSWLLKGLFNDRWFQINAMGKDLHYLENYWPHLWENTGKAQKYVREFFSKRPLEGYGKKHFRERTHVTFEDGLAHGLIPVTHNPVDMALQYLHSMDRYIAANRAFNTYKDIGYVRWATSPEKLPPLEHGLQWREINDSIAKPRVRVKGTKLLAEPGKWWALDPVAKVMNDYLHPGPERHVLYRGTRAYINRMNMFQLGLSAFHAFTTSYNAMALDGGLGVQYLGDAITKGDMHALKQVPFHIMRGMIPGVSLVNDMMIGAKVRDEWMNPGAYPDLAETVKRITAGNLPTHWPKEYFENDTQKFWNNMAQVSISNPTPLLKAGLHLLPAIFESVNRPIFDHIVPLGKLGAAAKLFERELHLENQGDPRVATSEARALRGMHIVDRIEDAMGQMQVDNLNPRYTPWWARSIAWLAFRAPTWNIGTARLGAHAVLDFAKEGVRAASGKGFEAPLATGYAVSLVAGLGLYNTLMQMWLTGKPPSSMKDLYAPQSGGVNEKGEPNRIWPKSYETDVVDFIHSPAKTLWNKASPAALDAYQFVTNKDFYGYEIRNPMDAPFGMKNIYNTVLWGITGHSPLSISNWQRQAQQGGSGLAKALSSIGVQPAPNFVTNDAFENRLDALTIPRMEQGPKPRETQQRLEQLRAFRRQRLEGKLPDTKLSQMVAANQITPEDAKRIKQLEQRPYIEQQFGGLNLKQALWAWEKATGKEKQLLGHSLAKKAQQIATWGVKTYHPEEVNQLEHQLFSSLSDQPQTQIEALLYMQAGREKLGYQKAHFDDPAKAPHMGRGLINLGLPSRTPASLGLHVRAHGPNQAVVDTLERIDRYSAIAVSKGDKAMIERLQTDRQQLLMNWYRRFQAAHPRTNIHTNERFSYEDLRQ